MTDSEKNLIEEANSILKQYPGILDQSKGIFKKFLKDIGKKPIGVSILMNCLISTEMNC